MLKKYLIMITAAALVLSSCQFADAKLARKLSKAPDFTLETIDGATVNLYQALKSKCAVIVFFATWCGPCMKEAPLVESFNKRRGAKIDVIAIDLKESKEKLIELRKNKKLSYTITMDKDGKVADSYGVLGIPTIIAVDKKGSVLYTGHDIVEMEKLVKFYD